MLTASGESIAGGVSAATGQGYLNAARTGNAGGFAPATDAAARTGMADQSLNALGVENQSANLARQQQLAGAAGLDSIYSGQNANTLRALGIADDASNQNSQAAQAYTNMGLKALGVGGYAPTGGG